MTYVYQLFPNVMLATFPNQLIMVVIDPVDIDHTMVTTYYMPRPIAGGPSTSASQPDDATDGLTLLSRGALEDNEMSEGVQRGLRAGANAFVEFGRHESAIGHFHAHLDEGLARLTSPVGD